MLLIRLSLSSLDDGNIWQTYHKRPIVHRFQLWEMRILETLTHARKRRKTNEMKINVYECEWSLYM